MSDSVYIWLTSGKYEQIEKHFNKSVLEENSGITSKLSDMWKQFTDEYGTFQYITDYAELDSSLGVFIIRNVVFEKDSIGIKVGINTNNQIITLLIVQPIVLIYNDADYVDTTKFEEFDIAFAEDNNITGKITIPKDVNKSKKKIPCVVLVHGSGPSDLDETISGRKPFRDIAFGLASNGIAVLRYNKRTYLGENIDPNAITLNEETINDAISAIEFVKNNYGNKINKIYILGHSLGGYSIPRIANKSKIANGFISLAGSSRPLPELIKEQYLYISELFGLETKAEKEMLEQIIKSCDLVMDNKFTKDTPRDSLPMGIPASYWLDLKDYDPVKELQKEKRSILFIQGGRDYQVTKKDFDGWKDGLSKNKNCSFVLIDDLNHLLQEGEGRSVPIEYSEAKNVSKKVIDNIVKWINK
jgi:fermentation-respiration switch protein FrsA (DUF1100 family)